jgi:hypothetical protein
MKKKFLATFALAIPLVMTGITAANYKSFDNPPGQSPCSHGNSGASCRPDPQPSHGKDCDQPNNDGNEDHCAGSPSPTASGRGTPSPTPNPSHGPTATPSNPASGTPNGTPTTTDRPTNVPNPNVTPKPITEPQSPIQSPPPNLPNTSTD